MRRLLFLLSFLLLLTCSGCTICTDDDIQEIKDASYQDGKKFGYDEGYQDASLAVYDEAYQDGYDQAMSDLNPDPCEPQSEEPPAVTVYVTTNGTKYHKDGCQYLSSSNIPISLEDAKVSYSPCSVCNPTS